MSEPSTPLDPDAAYREAQDRIAACHRKNSRQLDLSNLGLASVPPEIRQLERLQQLTLARNRLQQLPAEIWQLHSLSILDLSRNQLPRIAAAIADLSALRRLDVDNNRLKTLPVEFGQLSNLQHLFVGGNPLTTIPPAIFALSGLRTLVLASTELRSVSAQIGDLAALESLDLSLNKFKSLPAEIGKLLRLDTLFANAGQLGDLPVEFGRLKSLVRLDLSDNGLRQLPPQIGDLATLMHLDLHANQLDALPPEMVSLVALESLFLHFNPGLQIPISVLGPRPDELRSRNAAAAARPQDILSFYFAQRLGRLGGTLRAVNEIKVMLVGRGGAGKTSLRRFFMNEPHDKAEKETPGIALDTFQLPDAPNDIRVRLWDFAGQEITHALHHFFLTEGCVYILVLDPRSNTEMRDAEYWLSLLQRYANGAPVLLALNRQDARQGGYDVDRRALQERFPFIHSFTLTNCEKREGCAGLLQHLRETVAQLGANQPPQLQVPKTWLQIMAECDGSAGTAAAMSAERPAAKKPPSRSRKPAATTAAEAPAAPYLTLDQFRAICGRHGETDASKQESLARLLHQLGAVLHFVDEPRLRDTAVLNPHWVTDGVYRLLRFKDQPDSDGTLSLAEALQALPGETEHSARFFLRLMERFEMCFALDDSVDAGASGAADKPPTRWLIPGALGEFQPEGIGADWQQPGAVRLRYVYDPLPEGVLPRFIVMTHLLSQGQPRWRHGVVLRDGSAAVLVRRGEKPNHIEVTAFGRDDERLHLLQIVQGSLERIHLDLPEPRPVAEIELAGLADVYRPIADLEVAELGRQQLAVDTGQGRALVEPTLQLNQASEPASRDEARVPLRAFLSYAHEDRRAKDLFQQNLTVLAKKRLTTHWHDGLIEPGMQWQREIGEALSKMDLFVGLLTTAFLASEFIDNVELKAARQRLRDDGRDFLFVLIVVEDVSLKGLDLAQFQVLKPGGKAVNKHASRREGFNVAQRELEEIIKRRPAPRRRRSLMDAAAMRVQPVVSAAPGIVMLDTGGLLSAARMLTSQMSPAVGADDDRLASPLLEGAGLILALAPGPLKTHLQALTGMVDAMLAPVTKRGRNEVVVQLAESYSQLIRQSTSARPNKKWFTLAADELIDAETQPRRGREKLAVAIEQIAALLWPGLPN